MKAKEAVELQITGYSHDGRGVGRFQGQAVFVPGVIRGDKIRAAVKKGSKGVMTGQLLEILEPAEGRITPPCPVFGSCGGCQLQHLSYQGQLNFKQGVVEDALQRIGGFKKLAVRPVLGMEEPWGYRNKGHFRVHYQVGRISLGFYEEGSHSLVNRCCTHLFSKPVVEVLSEITGALNKVRPPVAGDGVSGLRHIMIRESRAKGEILPVFILSGEISPQLLEIAREICNNNSKIAGVCTNINPRTSGPVLGKRTEVICGKGEIQDTIGPFTFSISPHSFFQVNNAQAETLYVKAAEYAGLTGRELVVDAYCGIGTISLLLARKAGRVIGIETVPEAVRDAQKNARLNNISNVEFIRGQAEKVMPELAREGLKPQVVVVDPPRKGCGQPLLESIFQVRPERVVYVSCNPATLARDLRILAEGGYALQEVQPVDMFPQTAHVECVIMMTNSGLKGK